MRDHGQDVPRQEAVVVKGNLDPGELMFFYGLVGAQRGTCLVVAVLPHITPQGVYQCPEVTVLTRQMKLYTFLDEDPEEVRWERLSERHGV